MLSLYDGDLEWLKVGGALSSVDNREPQLADAVERTPVSRNKSLASCFSLHALEEACQGALGALRWS